jgi:3-deoxy-D-manno-octulosonate 8-phosphate phosphatase (KDO 8-P phosphatase)
MVKRLDPDELERRARRLRLLVSDVDGVLTDGGVYYSARGEELLRFSRRDGMGIELLRRAGIDTALLTRESSPIVLARAEKLEIRQLHAGVRDKRAYFGTLVSDAGVRPDEVGFIGDDVNDLELIELVSETGLCGAPADAHPALRRRVHFISEAVGGHGSFRQFADFILSLKCEEHA